MAFLSNKDVFQGLADVIRAGKINSEQESLLQILEVKFGLRDDSCQHNMDSTCDANNVFHCNGCGEVVPAPVAN